MEERQVTKVGYARVSRPTQKLDLQIDALEKEGCSKIFFEKVSGAKAKRPQLKACLEYLRPGDLLVFWKLDRLGRTMRELVQIVEDLHSKGIMIKSLKDPIDTTSPAGKLIFHIFASLAEFERNNILERSQAGREAAKAKGKLGGRRKGLSKEAKKTAAAAETLYKEQSLSVSEICHELSIAKSTLYRYLKHRGVKIGSNSGK